MNKKNQNTDEEVEEFFKNYQDRGMLKWAGFYLSDHTLKIQKDEEKRNEVYQKREEMTFEEISSLLMQAYSSQVKVSVQLRKLDNELKYSADISGYVLGFGENTVVLEDDEGKRKSIDLVDINNVIRS